MVEIKILTIFVCREYIWGKKLYCVATYKLYYEKMLGDFILFLLFVLTEVYEYKLVAILAS